MSILSKIWNWLKGKKRNIGLTLTLVLAWVESRGYVPTDVYQLLLALLTAWGIVAIADGVKKNEN